MYNKIYIDIYSNILIIYIYIYVYIYINIYVYNNILYIYI